MSTTVKSMQPKTVGPTGHTQDKPRHGQLN